MFNLRASKLQHMDDKQSSAPVGIDEESRISWAGMKSLANESGIEGEMFSWVPQGDQSRQEELFTTFKISKSPNDIDEQVAIGEQYFTLDSDDNYDSV